MVCDALGLVGFANDPQLLEPQVTDQETPALAESFNVSAVKSAVVPAATEVGGFTKLTAMALATIVRVEFALAAGLLVTDAVRVTVLPTGMREGAV